MYDELSNWKVSPVLHLTWIQVIFLENPPENFIHTSRIGFMSWSQVNLICFLFVLLFIYLYIIYFLFKPFVTMYVFLGLQMFFSVTAQNMLTAWRNIPSKFTNTTHITESQRGKQSTKKALLYTLDYTGSLSPFLDIN